MSLKPFFSVSSPLLPLGIHVTSDNYIVVGVTEPGNLYTPTDKSTRALLIFGMDGKQQHTYQYDSNKHRLFTTFILECPVYVHLKPPSHPTTTTLPVTPDVLSTTTMSLLLFVVILSGKVNSLCLLLSY
jgi:hypothetical protein